MRVGFSLASWLVYFFCYENVYDGDDVHYISLESFCNSCYTPDVYPNATYTEEVMQTQNGSGCQELRKHISIDAITYREVFANGMGIHCR